VLSGRMKVVRFVKGSSLVVVGSLVEAGCDV